MNIQVLRNQIDAFKIPLNASKYMNKIMGQHSLSFSFKSSVDLDLRVNDTLVYKGEEFTLNQTPDFKKISTHLFEYDFIFQGSRHSLEQYFLEHLGDRKFSYSGTAEEWLNLFVNCANTKTSGWTIGEFEDLGRVTIEFDSTYILDALTMVAQALKAEWGIKGKVISLKKTIGTPRSLKFEYGKGKGLYSISRKSINEKKIVTRAYARGGEKNLPEGMKDYFKIPGYIEKNVNLYQVRDGEFIDMEIYPRLTGAVTAVAQIDDKLFSIGDSALDFDLNGQRIDEETPKIVFKSGFLEGNEFEIDQYNHTTKTIRFKANDEGNGVLFPTSNVHAEIGDQYTVTGIRLPQSYIDAAVNELTLKRQEYLESNSSPRVAYELDVDILDLKRKNIHLEIGDTFRVVDEQKNIDELVRITELSYPAHYPEVLEKGMNYSAIIGNEVTYALFEKIQNDIKETKRIVTQTTRKSYEEDRILAMRMRQLQNLVFDPDGYFDGSKIKPNSIETLMLSVGAKSQNFLLNGVRINVNQNDDANAILITSGQLVHLEVKIEGLGYIWNMTQLSKNDLDPVKPYYLSARCSRTQLTGTWVVSDVPSGTESETGFYHFNVGVIYSAFENKRDYSFTNGMTYINGANIKTGKINADRLDVNEIVISGGGATVDQLNEAKQDANNYTNSKFNELGELAFEDLVQLAKLGETIIQGGYIKTDIIDLISLFAKYIEADNFWLKKGKIGIFDVENGQIRTESWSDSSNSNGVRFTNNGVLSRNANEQLFPSSSGLDYAGSLVGMVDQSLPAEQDSFGGYARAGLMGINYKDMNVQAMNQLMWSWGQYGVLASSLKVMGGVELPARIEEGTGLIQITRGDYTVIIGGQHTGANLPDKPNHGQVIVIKNARSSTITINAGTGHNFVFIDNSQDTSANIPSGKYRTYQFVRQIFTAGYWFEIGAIG